eukprot:223011_1
MESKSITLDANGIKSLNKDEMNGPAFGYGSGFDIGMESKSITLDANGIKSLNKDEMNGPAFGYGSGFDIGMESKSITLDANGIKSLNKDEMNGPAFGNGSGFDIGAAFGTNADVNFGGLEGVANIISTTSTVVSSSNIIDDSYNLNVKNITFQTLFLNT